MVGASYPESSRGCMRKKHEYEIVEYRSLYQMTAAHLRSVNPGVQAPQASGVKEYLQVRRQPRYMIAVHVCTPEDMLSNHTR